jgi:hypothetical protein
MENVGNTARSSGSLFIVDWWAFEHCLLQLTVEHLDEAVRVAMVVNAAALTFAPTQCYQVVLAVARVNQVARVPGQSKNSKKLDSAFRQRTN